MLGVRRPVSDGPGAAVVPALRASAFHVVGEFGRRERPSLEQIANGIGPDLCLFGLCMCAMILGFATGTVAELMGARVVPPGCSVVRRPVEDFEADVRMLQPNLDQLDNIFRRDPDREAPHVEWTQSHI